MEIWVLTTSYHDYEGGGSEVHGVYSSQDKGIRAAVAYQDLIGEEYTLDENSNRTPFDDVTWTRKRRASADYSMELTRFVIDEAAQ